MVKENYSLVAKCLADICKNRLNEELSLRERETRELFFWIISRLEWSVVNCWPGQMYHQIRISEGYSSDHNKVCLKHGSVSKYISHYVMTREEFYTVIHDVVDIFNEIGKHGEDWYHYYAICFTAKDNAEIAVNLSIRL